MTTPAKTTPHGASGSAPRSTRSTTAAVLLVARLWDGLSRIDGVRLFGPPPDARGRRRFSFTVGDLPSVEVSRRLAGLGIFASHGDFYATTVARRLGVAAQGLVRIGCACYSTEEEIDRVVDGIRVISKGR